MFEFSQIRCVIHMESDWNSIIFRIKKTPLSVQFKAIFVIFLSVGMIEFNHLLYEKAHVNSKQN